MKYYLRACTLDGVQLYDNTNNNMSSWKHDRDILAFEKHTTYWKQLGQNPSSEGTMPSMSFLLCKLFYVESNE